MAEAIHFYEILRSNNGMQNEISELNSQMQGLQPGSAEYEYDQLQLQIEQMMVQIRKDNPDIDPQTLAGNKALEQLLAQNPDYQAAQQQINGILSANPSESTKWGIPMDTDGAVYIELS